MLLGFHVASLFKETSDNEMQARIQVNKICSLESEEFGILNSWLTSIDSTYFIRHMYRPNVTRQIMPIYRYYK